MASVLLQEQHKCEPCLFDQTECSAVAFCVSCVEYLCKNCTRDHKKNKVTRDHRVLENEDVPKDPSVFKKMKELMSCSKHPSDKVTYRCEDHNQFICVTCLAVDHRRCEHVGEIKHIPDQETLPALLEKLRDNATDTTTLRKENLANLHSQHKYVEEQRAEFIKNLTEHIVKLGENSKAETDKKVMSKVKELEENISKCETVESEAKFNKQLLEVVMQFGDENEVSVVYDFVQKTTELLQTELQNQQEKNITTIKMTLERNLVFRDVDCIGRVFFANTCISETEPKDKITLDVSSDEILEDINTSAVASKKDSIKPKTTLQGAETSSKSFLQLRLGNTLQHSVKLPTDNYTCNINGIASLPKDVFVIIDRSNKKIKVFKNYFRFFCEQELENAPTDICKVRDGIAILSEGCKHVTVFEILGDKLNRCRQWATRLHCLSITSYRDLEVIILFSDQPSGSTSSKDILQVEIRDLFDGHIVQTFDVMKHFSEGSLTAEHRIHYTVKAGVIISENDKFHYFEKVEHDLIEKWFYKSLGNKRLEGISSIASDLEGNVYVSAKKSKNIHQVSATSHWKSRIIVSSTNDPTAVCVDSKKARLITARESDDYIYVSHLEK